MYQFAKGFGVYSKFGLVGFSWLVIVGGYFYIYWELDLISNLSSRFQLLINFEKVNDLINLLLDLKGGSDGYRYRS